MEPIRYRLDADCRLTSVCDHWLPFAEANAAAGLTEDAVIGRSLWEFVADPTTRALYEVIFGHVRQHREPVRVPFRCDSPHERRFMELEIEALGTGGLQLTSRLLRREPRDYSAVLDSELRHSDEVLVICGWCKRVETTAGEWLEVEGAIPLLGLFEPEPTPKLEHATCESCAESWH